MAVRLVVISGGLASGKTELANRLKAAYGCEIVRTADLIRNLKRDVGSDRRSMQAAGNKLDTQTGQSWIAEGVAKVIRSNGRSGVPVVLEGVRKPGQMAAIQFAIGHRYVRHVHLAVDRETQRQRFEARKGEADDALSFEAAIGDASERQVRQLAARADAVIDTRRYTKEDVFSHVSARLNLQSRSADRLVDVLVGGQYGSEGKGNIADYLSPEYDVLIRVGGPNAGHIVYEEPPYTHVSLPCGTRRNDRTELIVGPGSVLDPATLLKEIRDCEVEPSRLTIDENAVLISEQDRGWEAATLKPAIGSTAMGVGKATARRITGRLRDENCCKLAKDVAGVCPDLVPYVGSTMERLERAYSRGARILPRGHARYGIEPVSWRLPFRYFARHLSFRLSLGGRHWPAEGEPDRARLSDVSYSCRRQFWELLDGDKMGGDFGKVRYSGGRTQTTRSRISVRVRAPRGGV